MRLEIAKEFGVDDVISILEVPDQYERVKLVKQKTNGRYVQARLCARAYHSYLLVMDVYVRAYCACVRIVRAFVLCVRSYCACVRTVWFIEEQM